MSIFRSKQLNKNDKKKMDKQLTDYCKSIGIQKKDICDSVIKNCIQNVNDPDLFDQEKFKFDNETEIENEKKCSLAWGRNFEEQKRNIIESYNLKYLVEPPPPSDINRNNLFNKDFSSEKWINKLVPNNLKKEILNVFVPNIRGDDNDRRIRNNRINNFNDTDKLFIFSQDLIQDITNCNEMSDIGKYNISIDNHELHTLINIFKSDKNNENYKNLVENIKKFIHEEYINISKLTIDDIFMLQYISISNLTSDDIYQSKRYLIFNIIEKFIQIYISVNNIELLNNIEEWCLYVHKNKSFNNLSVFDCINNNISKITEDDIYLAFDIIKNSTLYAKLSKYISPYSLLINSELLKKNANYIDYYCKDLNNKKIYIKLLCKIFKLTNDDFIYNVFFYIVKKSIFEDNNKDYSNFLYYIFINYSNIYYLYQKNRKLKNVHLDLHKNIKESIELIAKHANYGTYDDAINLDNKTMQKPLKFITTEMFERLINNIRQINSKTEYQIDIRPIENAIKKIIKDALLVDGTSLPSEMDIYKKLNTVQIQLPIEKSAIYDIGFILKNLPLFKNDLQKQKVQDYSWIYKIEKVYSYYSDNLEKNNLRDVNEYFAKSMKLVNGQPIMTTTYDELLYLFEFFNEYNRRKTGKPIIKNIGITDKQFITNLRSELIRIKTRKKLANIHSENEFAELNKWFYDYLIKIIRNENFKNFSEKIKNVVQSS